jgi:hypothetical protein
MNTENAENRDNLLTRIKTKYSLHNLIQRKFVHFPHPQCDAKTSNGNQTSTREQPIYCKGLFLSFRFPSGSLVHGSFKSTYSEAISELLELTKNLVKVAIRAPELQHVPPFEKSNFFPVLEESPPFYGPQKCDCDDKGACTQEHIQEIPSRDEKKYTPVLFSKLPEAPRLVDMPKYPDLIQVDAFSPPKQLPRIPDRSDFVPPKGRLLATIGRSFCPRRPIQSASGDSRVVVGILSIMGIGTHFADVLLFLEKMAEICDALIFVYSQFAYDVHYQVLNSQNCIERLNSCAVAHIVRMRESESIADDAHTDFDFAMAAAAAPGGTNGALAPVFCRATHFVAAYFGFGRGAAQRGAGAEGPLQVTPIDLTLTAEPPSTLEPEPDTPNLPAPAWSQRIPLPSRKDFLPPRARLPRLPPPVQLNLEDLPDPEPPPPEWTEPSLAPEELVRAPPEELWDPMGREACLGLDSLPQFVQPELEVPPVFEPDLVEATRLFPQPPPPPEMDDDGGDFEPEPYPPDLPIPSRWRPERRLEPVGRTRRRA